MNHKSFEKQLSAYVDNELNESEAKSVWAHIEGCSLCQQQVQVLRAIRMSIREAASVVLPESFIYSVQRAGASGGTGIRDMAGPGAVRPEHRCCALRNRFHPGCDRGLSHAAISGGTASGG